MGKLADKTHAVGLLWCTADVDYCGFKTMELGYSAKSKRLMLIALEKAFETEESAEEAFRTVRKNLESEYALRPTVGTGWQTVSSALREGCWAEVPGGLKMTVVKVRDAACGILLRVVLQNDRLLEFDAGIVPTDQDVGVAVGL